jgi:hypothetical protein
VYPTDLVQLEVRESNGNACEAKNCNSMDDTPMEKPVAVEREG